MKCLIIANSHGSALQFALREGWCFKEMELDFIIIPGRVEPRFVREGERLFPLTKSNSLRTSIAELRESGVDPKEYDSILLSGFGIAGPHDDELTAGDALINRAYCSTWVGRQLSVTALSKSVMSSLLNAHLNKVGCSRTLSLLSEMNIRNIAVQIRPRMSSHMGIFANDTLKDLYGDDQIHIVRGYLDLHDEVACSKVLEIFPAAKILSQPIETITDGFTNKYFALARDHLHMNARYGQLVLDQWQKAILDGVDDVTAPRRHQCAKVGL